ncbi:hypothetical protein [Largemouth bass virus]|uniref:Uncharacterized protein n=1 Tax=Largemouth bass virus TaxID=176656 RepID=A0A9E7PPD8_9VIRU|nr:hypothetical protein [Mandarin fish ranavirus]UUY86231.1 hypothetical protein [Largemouth bass virus]WEI28971.1 hypothetical protein [Largemouth bass virus]WHA35538.1 hypothetical protein MSRaV_50R [Micropterus salmoides ranavirus]WHA35643.1 hypothetical protein SCRaV_50R [Siniperca chuatsi ranavirus]
MYFYLWIATICLHVCVTVKLLSDAHFYRQMKTLLTLCKALFVMILYKFMSKPAVVEKNKGRFTISFMDGNGPVTVKLQEASPKLIRAVGKTSGADYTSEWQALLRYRQTDFEPIDGCVEPVELGFEDGSTFTVEQE